MGSSEIKSVFTRDATDSDRYEFVMFAAVYMSQTGTKCLVDYMTLVRTQKTADFWSYMTLNIPLCTNWVTIYADTQP